MYIRTNCNAGNDQRNIFAMDQGLLKPIQKICNRELQHNINIYLSDRLVSYSTKPGNYRLENKVVCMRFEMETSRTLPVHKNV
jgi:hypothetical protein